MEKAKKMTKRDYFNILKEMVVDNVELTAFINRELELLERKASHSTETKTQKENVVLLEVITEVMATLTEPARIATIMALDPRLETLTNQKVSALLKKLVDTEVVERSVIKKETYFKLV